MKNLFTRGLCLVLILTLALSLAACGGNTTETTAGTEATPDTTAAPEFVMPDVTVENPVTYFAMNLGENFENVKYLSVFSNEDGTAHVEYTGDVKKIGDLDGKLFHALAQKIEELNLTALNGQSVFEEGEASGAMYIEFADGTSLMADFYGTIAEEYTTAFNAMEAFFQEFTASIPEYVPQLQVMGEVDADAMAAVQELMNNSGIKELDAFTVSSLILDDSFSFMAGLSSSEGIVNATSCSPMMMTNAFSLVVVTLEDETKIDAVRADFEANLDWRKWVCVAPAEALIAQKGNMVLCMMGTGLSTFVENTEWTNVATFENPDM